MHPYSAAVVPVMQWFVVGGCVQSQQWPGYNSHARHYYGESYLVLNRTYGRHKNLYIAPNNIWSYQVFTMVPRNNYQIYHSHTRVHHWGCCYYYYYYS